MFPIIQLRKLGCETHTTYDFYDLIYQILQFLHAATLRRNHQGCARTSKRKKRVHSVFFLLYSLSIFAVLVSVILWIAEFAVCSLFVCCFVL